MKPFSRALLSHRLDRLVDGLASLQGETLAAISEALPPVRFDGQPASALEVDLLEFNNVVSAWHRRLSERKTSAATLARIERKSRGGR